jgi:aminoglycoside 3-N-acetyltransferase
MQRTTLFQSARGEVTNTEMLDKLKKVNAGECEVLYIHTDMTFGLPAKGLKRSEILAAMLETIESLGVKTLVFPTFTFSFCNDEIYDVQNSKTDMGALNEYVRKTGRGARSRDPLLSVYILGDKLNLVNDLGIYSLGQDSNYDRLHSCGKKVKFLFYGADMRACFTYGHYMEAIIGIPYRYDRVFTGSIIDKGVVHPDQKAILYTTYANVRLNPEPVVYNGMMKRKQLQIESIGDSLFCCFNETDAFETISELLHENPLCMTDGSYDDSIRDKTYIKSGRITSVK